MSRYHQRTVPLSEQAIVCVFTKISKTCFFGEHPL